MSSAKGGPDIRLGSDQLGTQRSIGKGGQGGGGGRPSNVLHDHFSDSSNSGVKNAEGGGVRPMILAIIMCMSIGFYNLTILIAFYHDLYGIYSNLLSWRSPQIPVLRTLHGSISDLNSLWKT